MGVKQTFACSKCRAKYPWSAEVIGKVAKCACGSVLKVPAAPEDTAAESGAAAPASAKPAVAAVAAPRTSMMGDQTTAVDRLFSAPDADALPEDVEAELAGLEQFAEKQSSVAVYDDVRDRKVPVGLLAVGGMLMLAQVLVQVIRYDESLVGSIIGSVLGVAINVVLMLVGVVLASKLGGINFGELKPALLKLTGIFIGPIVLGELVTQALGDNAAVAILGNACAILACWFLIYYLFALDGQQTMLCVIAIGVVRIAVVVFIIGTIPFTMGSGGGDMAFEEPEFPGEEQLDQAMLELESQADDDDF